MSTHTPAVSVIMTVHNEEDHLLDALRSIGAQTFTDFEVVVWDDGSTDRTPELLQSFAAKDDRVRVLSSVRNRGPVVGRNFAIDVSRAAWLAICDADDVWLPQKLERQMAVLQHHSSSADADGLVALGSSGHHINAEGRVRGFFDVGLHDEAAYDNARASSDVFYLLNSSAIFRRDVFQLVGGYREDYFPGEDVDLWTRMAEHGLILNLEEPLVHYRVHGHSVSDHKMIKGLLNTQRVKANARRRHLELPELSHLEFLDVLRSHPTVYRRLLRSWMAQSLYRSAGGALANGRYLAGAAAMLRALVMDVWVPFERAQRQVFRHETMAQLLRP
ncbi:glycosyltransferase family 2 protein [Euzebya tangerina]|nr:glycosyltransferase family 2 protein [Euzebya tangerina]